MLICFRISFGNIISLLPLPQDFYTQNNNKKSTSQHNFILSENQRRLGRLYFLKPIKIQKPKVSGAFIQKIQVAGCLTLPLYLYLYYSTLLQPFYPDIMYTIFFFISKSCFSFWGLFHMINYDSFFICTLKLRIKE